MKMNKSVFAAMLACTLSAGSLAQTIEVPREMKPAANVTNAEAVTYQSVLPKGARLVAGNNPNEFFIMGRAEVPQQKVERDEPTYQVAELNKQIANVPVAIHVKEAPAHVKIALDFNRVGSKIKEALREGDRKAVKSTPRVAVIKKKAISKVAMTRHHKGVKYAAKVVRSGSKMAMGNHRPVKSVPRVLKTSQKATKLVSKVALRHHKVAKIQPVLAKSKQKVTKVRHMAMGGKVISI